jgi:hypothetical protein
MPLTDSQTWGLAARLGRETLRHCKEHTYIGGDIVRDAQFLIKSWDRETPVVIRVRSGGTWIATSRLDLLREPRETYLLVAPQGEISRVTYGRALLALPEQHTQPRRCPRHRDDQEIKVVTAKARAFADSNDSRATLDEMLLRLWQIGCNTGTLRLQWSESWEEITFSVGSYNGGLICHGRDGSTQPHWSIHT